MYCKICGQLARDKLCLACKEYRMAHDGKRDIEFSCSMANIFHFVHKTWGEIKRKSKLHLFDYLGDRRYEHTPDEIVWNINRELCMKIKPEVNNEYME